MKAPSIQVEFLEAPAVDGGLSPDGDEYFIGFKPGFATVRGLNRERLTAGDYASRLGADQDAYTNRVQFLCDGPRELGIVLGQNARHRLDHRHLRAELREGGPELQTDIAGTDDTSRSGRWVSASASADDITAPPKGRDGNSTATEPVAITTVSARMTCRPVSVWTSTVLPSRNRAHPAIDLTPARFSRPETPVVIGRQFRPSRQSCGQGPALAAPPTDRRGFEPKLPR